MKAVWRVKEKGSEREQSGQGRGKMRKRRDEAQNGGKRDGKETHKQKSF